ncbi:hypothetical protein JCM17844_07130 [Iodidimonas gelatinilytica]|uniref:Uncharacterized protein n=1 Tax=Iodidimonas gelatinilytica TaxID=1236966 RepID=A0A5A7MMK9_9PROT|nr:hypothetical protein [Iodidimonas gelatinilytica]GEQ97076.1 hypothetical protein JCM17844_07130 [Iodidimonas gelatinilytica]
MDANSFIIYLHELRNQCLYTHSALSIFNQSLEKKSQTGVLFSGQAALNAASQVGAILWPSRARARRRGEVLREKLQLPDSHALGDRRFVELWEHADEKLDEWIKSTKGQRVLFDFVGDPKTIDLPGLKEDCIYRLYDTTSHVFVFRGLGYNMVNLSKAIEEIGRRTEILMKQIMDQVQGAEGEGRAEEPANNDSPPQAAPTSASEIEPLSDAAAATAEEPKDSAEQEPAKADAPAKAKAKATAKPKAAAKPAAKSTAKPKAKARKAKSDA